jgi:hypothetical protein
MTFSAHPLVKLTLLASVAALYACGGGGGSSDPVANNNTGTTTSTGSASGILTDAAIQGVSYATSSGVTGVTGANGSYNYNPGDTVTFKLGAVTLGSVTANGIISPIDLAGGDAVKFKNLLVLVQSLDSDGNPANGISIPSAAAAALPSTLDLAQAVEATFAASIATAATTSGSGGVVTSTNANAHFLAQAMPLLASNVYTFGSGGLVRFSASGEYLHGQVNPTDSVRTGVEHGTVTVDIADAHGFHLTSSNRDVDTNGDAGVNNDNSECQRVVPVGEGLYAPNTAQRVAPCNFLPGNPVSLRKAANDPTGIVGVWAVGSATTIKTSTIVISPDGTFLNVDPIHPGIEAGTYTYNTTTKIFTIPTTLPYDTNGSSGVSDGTANTSNQSLVLSSDGMTIAVNGGPGNVGGATLYRISK